MSKFCPLKGFDHLKFYVGNAKQVEHFHSQGCGFTNTADRGLETGDRQRASYEMKQDNLRLLLSTGLNPDYAIDPSAISFPAVLSLTAQRQALPDRFNHIYL